MYPQAYKANIFHPFSKIQDFPRRLGATNPNPNKAHPAQWELSLSLSSVLLILSSSRSRYVHPVCVARKNKAIAVWRKADSPVLSSASSSSNSFSSSSGNCTRLLLALIFSSLSIGDAGGVASI